MASGRLDTLSAINIKLPILRNDIKVLESSKPGLCFTAPDVENVRALISDRDWADLKDRPAFIRFPNVGVALLDPGKKLKRDPRSLAEANNREDKRFWFDAAYSEFAAIDGNHKKLNTDGSIDKYKARLVVQGFRQKFGVDYVDTFAPVMRFSTVRLIFALSAAKNCEMHHVDVKNAFLNGDLEEDIYVKPPTGIDHNTPPGMVWKLNKSLYGLKQAPLCWNKKLVDKLEALGYKAAKKEPCLFYKINGKDFSIIGLYVDDILTASNVPGEFERFFKGLSGYFAIKDEGGVNKFLGIRVQDSDRTISLDLEHYIADMIEVFKLSNQTAKSIPLPKKHGLDFPQGLDARPANQSLYRSILGKLQFAAQTARPDIAYATGKLAQYSSDPRAIHMDRAYHVLSYLKGTKDLAIVYHKNVPGASPRLLRGWSDADWANDPDRKSISGFAFSHGPSTFSWKSAKQKLTATSTTEAELIAAFVEHAMLSQTSAVDNAREFGWETMVDNLCLF
ncbi:uncharacterized protein SAPINGB_P005385 [Magnusiomyces paraingens]|uniref:Reverse transcriptase Ty1/copia-type domain-containing protein n=1 Tax=Magnusiomyces paraingens TaxID=2606893 RepID=A0A5E8C4X9_9ASCO|nr:uncharacterized protein SAPINGB_P005385 [Saprochaete ingens]VVT56898.1 unnamed protein product [Saprochaete ingens]